MKDLFCKSSLALWQSVGFFCLHRDLQGHHEAVNRKNDLKVNGHEVRLPHFQCFNDMMQPKPYLYEKSCGRNPD